MQVSLPFTGKCHTVPLNCFPYPLPPPVGQLFFPVQANWCFLLWKMSWASFNQSHLTFLRSFLLICTQTVFSHDMEILKRILPGGFFIIFFPPSPYIYLGLLVIFCSSLPNVLLNGHTKGVEALLCLYCLSSLEIKCNINISGHCFNRVSITFTINRMDNFY